MKTMLFSTVMLLVYCIMLLAYWVGYSKGRKDIVRDERNIWGIPYGQENITNIHTVAHGHRGKGC